MNDEIKRKNGRRLSVASFEDKQEAMEIIDLVLAPVCHILNRWAGDPVAVVPVTNDEETGEEKFLSFQELLEELDFSDDDSWSLCSFERLKIICRRLQNSHKISQQ